MRLIPSFTASLIALIAGLLLAGISGDAASLTRGYYFERIGSERGLAQNTVNALVQDPQGFVWVATQGGLHRYDGQRYVQYRHDPRDPASLPDSYVTAMAIEGDHSLWVGSYSQYVSRLDLASGAIRRYEVADGKQAHRQVAALLPHAGKVWVGTLAGLERLDPATGTRDRVITLDPRTLRSGPTQALVAGRQGEVWYGAPSGLYRIGPRGGVEPMRPALSVRSLAYDHRGQLWVGSAQGLFRLASDGHSLLRVWPAEGQAESEVRAIVEAPDRSLWLSLGTHGLLRLDPATGLSVNVREQAGMSGGLPEDGINTLMLDRGGMLWLGGQFRGVTITDPLGTRFRFVLNITGDANANTNAAVESSVRGMAQDNSGALWVSTDDSRLLRYDLQGDRFEDFTDRLPREADAPAPRVLAISRDPSGDLWLASARGLMRLQPATARIEQVALGDHTHDALRSVVRVRDGSLWLGTQTGGAMHYTPSDQGLSVFGHRDDDPRQLSHPTVHAVLEDRRGRIWLGTGDGLDLFDPATTRMRHFRHGTNAPGSLPGNLVRALWLDKDGQVWVGTHAGLSRVIENADGISFAHPLADALRDRPVPVVFSIFEAPAGTLWLGTDNGIVRFDARTERYRFYGMADGLQDLEFNGGAVAPLTDGRLVFGGVRGFNLFDPRNIADSHYLPPLRLLSARVGADASGKDSALWQPQALSIPDGAELLRLRVGALDYAQAASIQYRYRLDGFDKRWIENGRQQDISYTRLPPGDYVLRVQATNRDGVWSPQELRMPVNVMPPWWRHPRVIAVAALFLLALLAVLAWRHHEQTRRERGLFDAIREREQRLKLALWGSGEIFWDYDLQRGDMHAMRIDEHGMQEADSGMQLVGQHEIHPDDLPRLRELLRQHVRGQTPLLLSEHRVRLADGHWAWMLARGRVVDRDATGLALRIAGTARDVTHTRNAERERRIASEVLRSMAEAVCVFDRDFAFVSVNPAFTRMTGYTDVEVLGRDTGLLNSAQHDPEFYRQMRFRLERDGRWSGELWQQRNDGQEFLCWVQASVVLDATGQRSHYVGVLSDITDQKRAEQELRYLANYDTLTSLPNRTLLSERLSRAIVRARRQGKRIAVLFLDLDRFKDINDSLGHAAGDRILRAAAARLQHTVGPQHTVARLGGDEFTVVLEDIDTADQAEQVARKVIDAFSQPLDLDDRHDVAISPSIGISLYPDHAQIPTDLLKHADTAMYQAKAAGRRTFMRYTDAMDVEIRQRATISAALRKVLDRNELQLVFQPKLSLTQMRITGVEALLRWHSPEYGSIPPDRFIPLAEESGLILEIGEWAMQEACATLQHWRAQGLDDVSMAVNISALQLARGHLPDIVGRALSGRGIPPQRLQLELTETVIMANAEQNAATLQAIRELGVGLAIDDFGTGYSSLAYLKRLPLTTLKIDKEFIGDLTRDADDEAITGAVIAMAHSLGLIVVAEGVETEAQVRFLHEHGCDEIQGYWLAQPLHADECLTFLRSWATAADETGRRVVSG